MLLPSFILLSMLLMGDWFAASDASSSSKKSSCGRPVLKKCACLTVNPCEVDNSEPKKKIITANDVRNNIRPELPTELHLSGRDYAGIDANAFDDFTNLTRVFLADNKISKLPESVFSKLTNLQHLSLANNDIKGTKNVFAGLKNLKTLDITGNPLTDTLNDNCFYGLTDSCDILIRGVKGLQKIGSNAFGNETVPFVEDLPTPDLPKDTLNSKSRRSAQYYWGSTREDESKNFRAQICMEGNIVQRLDILKSDENQTSECKEIEFAHSTLTLTNLEISEFKEGWYQLQDGDVPPSLSSIHLNNNNIIRATGFMKALPKYITWVDMNNNKIERLEEGCFEHEKIFSFNLNSNLISTIEDNAFKMPALYQLELGDNRLTDTKFAATLPTGLVSLDLKDNQITEISENSLSKLTSLRYLSLSGNKITTLHSHFLHGATLVNQLSLSNNGITVIEPGAFEGYTGFQIFLSNNNISSIDSKSFSGLEKLQQLNLDNNKLTKLERGTLNFPNMRLLQVRENKITKIETGALKTLGKLEELDISRNPIKKLENGALFGMNKTLKSYVDVTATPIEIIQGGVFDKV